MAKRHGRRTNAAYLNIPVKLHNVLRAQAKREFRTIHSLILLTLQEHFDPLPVEKTPPKA